MKTLNPDNLWSDSFIDDGLVEISFDSNGELSNDYANLRDYRCIGAYDTDNEYLVLVFKRMP